MDHMVRKILAAAMVALLAATAMAPAVSAEGQAVDAAPQAEQADEPAQTIGSEAGEPALKEQAPEAAADAEQVEEPVLTEQAGEAQSAEAEALAADELELVVIEDERIPLAGGAQPSISIRANRALSALSVGDNWC